MNPLYTYKIILISCLLITTQAYAACDIDSVDPTWIGTAHVDVKFDAGSCNSFWGHLKFKIIYGIGSVIHSQNIQDPEKNNQHVYFIGKLHPSTPYTVQMYKTINPWDGWVLIDKKSFVVPTVR